MEALPGMSSAPGFPVQSIQWQEPIVEDTVTFLYSKYSNMNLLVITHTGTMGTIVRARCAAYTAIHDNRLEPTLHNQT
jgi:hypothetical protein